MQPLLLVLFHLLWRDDFGAVFIDDGLWETQQQPMFLLMRPRARAIGGPKFRARRIGLDKRKISSDTNQTKTLNYDLADKSRSFLGGMQKEEENRRTFSTTSGRSVSLRERIHVLARCAAHHRSIAPSPRAPPCRCRVAAARRRHRGDRPPSSV